MKAPVKRNIFLVSVTSSQKNIISAIETCIDTKNRQC